MIKTNDTLNLLKTLIAKPSLTPDDQGCQRLIAERLETLGFTSTHLRFEDVDNLWITHGSGTPLLVFAGHTDVVPPGPLDQWTSDPFVPVEKNNILYGRGAADMKSGLSAMVVASERFVKAHPNHKGTLALLITSNEEGDPKNGTQRVVKTLIERGIHIDYCVVGEASSKKKLGDMVKHGRRGSLNGILTVQGTQGHVAYPQLADNAIHKSLGVLLELTEMVWDHGNEDFPPTTFQLSDIHAGTHANNIIPGTLSASFNLRYSTAITVEALQQKIESLFKQRGIAGHIAWQPSGGPFLTAPGKLRDTASFVIEKITGIQPVFSTEGGTSDGRFIAPMGAQVVEIGPCNASIHKANECIDIAELEPLTAIYQEICQEIL